MENNNTDLSSLLRACKELDVLPGKLSDVHAHSFFSDFTLERIFRALAQADSQAAVTLVSHVLGRLLETDLGPSMLPSALPYLAAAASSSLPPLRRLAAEQYGRMLMPTVRQRGPTVASADGTPTAAVRGTADVSDFVQICCLALASILTSDPDAAVAAAAARALRLYGSSSVDAVRGVLAPGSAVAAALAASAASGDAAVRMRVLGLALELAMGDGRPHLANGHHTSPSTQLNSNQAIGQTTTGTAMNNGGGPSSTPDARTAAEYEERSDLLRASGLLQPLLHQLSDASDPLACLAALQLLEDLLAGRSTDGRSGSGDDDVGVYGSGSAGGSAAAVALAGTVLPQLVSLLSEPTLADAAMPLVASIVRRSLPEVLPPVVVAAAVSASESSQAAPHPNSATAATASAWQHVLRAAPALLTAVRAVLDDRGDASPAAEASGLDALGTLGQSRAGAQLVLADGQLVQALCERALGRSPHGEVRLAALHAVASLAGLERAGWERCRASALLPTQYEEPLRHGIFGACGPRKRPGEVLLGLLEQPFVEIRLASYRCLAALSLRGWFAVEVVTTPDLFDRIISSGSESGSVSCSWRHTAAAALWATVSEVMTSSSSSSTSGETASGDALYVVTLAAPAVVERLRAAVLAGPYGFGADVSGGAVRAAHDQHFVATRGGGGGV